MNNAVSRMMVTAVVPQMTMKLNQVRNPRPLEVPLHKQHPKPEGKTT